MQISKVVKRFLALDLTIGIAITIITWMNLGTEGMAARFCSLTNVERCNEIEWSEEYEMRNAPIGSGVPTDISKDVAEIDARKSSRRESDYKLKYNLY